MKKQFRIAVLASLCICCLISIKTNNRYLMFTPQEELPQYKFKYDIESSGISNPTLLNYGFLDGGFYTTTGIVPNIKYFCKLNIPLEEMLEQQDYYIENGITDFIVSTGKNPLKCSRYTLIDSTTFYFEGVEQTYRLYQRNE